MILISFACCFLPLWHHTTLSYFAFLFTLPLLSSPLFAWFVIINPLAWNARSNMDIFNIYSWIYAVKGHATQITLVLRLPVFPNLPRFASFCHFTKLGTATINDLGQYAKTVTVPNKPRISIEKGRPKKVLFWSFFLLTLFEITLKYPYVSQQANINRQ